GSADCSRIAPGNRCSGWRYPKARGCSPSSEALSSPMRSGKLLENKGVTNPRTLGAVGVGEYVGSNSDLGTLPLQPLGEAQLPLGHHPIVVPDEQPAQERSAQVHPEAGGVTVPREFHLGQLTSLGHLDLALADQVAGGFKNQLMGSGHLRDGRRDLQRIG